LGNYKRPQSINQIPLIAFITTMKKTYLVTGGTGFIGSALVRRLVKEGHKVRVLDNDLRGAKERLSDIIPKLEIIKADIRDSSAVANACKGVDSIIHLAYLNGTEFFYKYPELVLDIGVKGMVNVIDGAIKHNIKEFILASSSEVYQSPPFIPTDERVPLMIPDPLNPRYSYGGGKIISELMTINYGKKHFDRAIIFRPHNVYGPDMGWEHVIPQFMERMKILSAKQKNEAIQFPIQGTGNETRAFIYIDDFINGLMAVLNKGKHLNIYHIGTMEEISVRGLANHIGKCFGKVIEQVHGPLTEGSIPRRCPDTSKLEKLGFAPKISLQEGLNRTAEWYKAHNPPKNSLAKLI